MLNNNYILSINYKYKGALADNGGRSKSCDRCLKSIQRVVEYLNTTSTQVIILTIPSKVIVISIIILRVKTNHYII